MNRDELIDTIQRLLALSSSCNEHESAIALARANDLMAKHNISIIDVEAKQSTEYIIEDIFSGGRSQNTEPFLCDILQKYFFVKAISSRNQNTRITTLKFFGDKTNVEIAKYIYKFLDVYFKRLADYHKIQARDRRTYYAGLSTGFKEKLKEERETLNQNNNNKNALVLVDKALVQAFNSKFANTKTKMSAALSNNMDIYNQGVKEGKNINLRRGSEGMKQPKLLS